MNVETILNAVNTVAPFDGACDWDRCGLQCGDPAAAVTGVLLTLDADLYALEQAEQAGCNVVVSHHPLLLDPPESVTPAHPVYHYLRRDIAVISAHTCLDAAEGGVNDQLARIARIAAPKKLYEEDVAIGRYGDVAFDGDFTAYVDLLKAALGAPAAQYIQNRPVRRAAAVSGAGGGLVRRIAQYGCDTLITGECKHDAFVYADNVGLNVIALGHFETENIILAPLRERMAELLPGLTLAVNDRVTFTRRR